MPRHSSPWRRDPELERSLSLGAPLCKIVETSLYSLAPALALGQGSPSRAWGHARCHFSLSSDRDGYSVAGRLLWPTDGSVPPAISPGRCWPTRSSENAFSCACARFARRFLRKRKCFPALTRWSNGSKWRSRCEPSQPGRTQGARRRISARTSIRSAAGGQPPKVHPDGIGSLSLISGTFQAAAIPEVADSAGSILT